MRSFFSNQNISCDLYLYELKCESIFLLHQARNLNECVTEIESSGKVLRIK